MITDLIAFLTVLSWIYWLVAYMWVHTFLRSQREITGDFTPPISILKPVKGVDAQAYENFESFCHQDYPEYEIIFGVAEPDDPIIPVIERLQRNFPDKSISLHVTPVQGTNRKAGLLAELTPLAQHALLAISDSDMRVTPDYLRRVVAPLEDPQIGLVTCLYRPEAPSTLTARLEALHMGVTFLPSVMIARRVLSMRFAMGATDVLRRADLERIGGFSAVAHYLADDYQLGFRIAALGMRVNLSDYIVACYLGGTTFRTQWRREVRWAQCSRTSQPLGYPGLLVSFSTPLAIVLLLLTDFSQYGWLTLGASLFVRWAVGWGVTASTDDMVSRRWLFLLPIRDMLSALVWCAGLLGRVVVWRGERFILEADGRLSQLPARRAARSVAAGSLVPRLVRPIDAFLQRYEDVYEFCQDDQCVLRLSIGECRREIVLSDGTQLAKGEPVGDIHYWNEHIPRIPEDGPNLAWALAFQRRCVFSLIELANFIRHNPHLIRLKAFRGNPPLGGRYGDAALDEMIERWGFDVLPRRQRQGWWGGFVQYWENLYAFGLRRAFNPDGVKSEGLQGIKKVELWISTGKLLQEYGGRKRAAPAYREQRVAGWHADEAKPVGRQSSC
jgi:ceramide glucosyltransferase